MDSTPFEANREFNLAPYRTAVKGVLREIESFGLQDGIGILEAAIAEIGLHGLVDRRIMREMGKQDRVQNQG